MHDIVNNLLVAQSVKPQIIQATAINTGNIDRQGSENLAIVVLTGAIADTLDGDNRIDIKIEHADDNGASAPDAYVACTDTDVLNASGLSSGIFLSLDNNDKTEKRYIVEYIGHKRFVKITATPISLETGGAIAMLAIKGATAQKPADNS